MMGKTLLDKIWDAHTVRIEDGGRCVLYIDRQYIHEVTSPVAFAGLDRRGIGVARPSQITATADHNIPTLNQHLPIEEPESRRQVAALEANCAKYGIEHFGVGNPRQGIVHIIGPELGFTQPGMTIVCGDSHTSTHGALGAVAFGVGYAYLTHMETLPWLNYIFIVCLFGTGIQFGASNLLPEMFKADVLDDLELKTGSRLDASLGFFIGIGGTISGALANIAVPYILYGDGSIIQYQQGLGDGTAQTPDTKIMLLLFYTVFHGLMMLLAGLPFLFYKLSGAERERVHTEVLKMREELAQSEGVEAAE